MSAPELYPHVAAVVAQLDAAGLTVGNHRAPTTGAQTPNDVAPYTAVYLVAGGTVDGSLGVHDDEAELIVQLTSVGTGPEQALRQADLGRAALATPVNVLGRATYRPRLVTASNGAARDDDVTPPLFFCVDRFALRTVPA